MDRQKEIREGTGRQEKREENEGGGGRFPTCTGNDSQPLKTPVTYRAGQAGVEQNDRADRLAGEVRLGRSEVLRSLRHYLQAQSRGHHTIDRLEDRGVVTESARRPSLKDQKGPVNQANIETVSTAKLGNF